MTSSVTQRKVQESVNIEVSQSSEKGKAVTTNFFGTCFGKYASGCTVISSAIASGMLLKGYSFTAVALTAASGPIFAIGSISALIAYDAIRKK